MRTLRLLVGSVLVYLLVACANASAPLLEQMAVDAGLVDAPEDSPSQGLDAQGASSGGSSSGVGADGMAGILDALTDPVPEAQADPSASGSRLKLQYYVGSDGSKAFAQILDTTTGKPCSYTTAADGMTRCLPSGAGLGGYFFSDSACTTAIAQAYAGCAAPAYATGAATSSCVLTPGVTHVYQVGAQVTGAIYEKAGATCTNVTASVTPYTFYGVGAEVPASSFVAATLQSL